MKDVNTVDANAMEKVERCAAILHRAARTNEAIVSLPQGIAPATRAEAYAVQTHLAELSGQPTVGWKIAATSEAGQRHVNVDGPMGGRVLADSVHADGAAVPLSGNTMHLAEPEFVFVLDSALSPRPATYAAAEVLEAVRTLHLGIELPSTRFTDVTEVGLHQLIADNACGHRFVLGPPVDATWKTSNLAAVTMTATVDGPAGNRSVEGRGANVLGDPIAALTWIVNELASVGTSLQAGDFITTGTCSEPIPVKPGDLLSAHYQGLGAVTCTFVV